MHTTTPIHTVMHPQIHTHTYTHNLTNILTDKYTHNTHTHFTSIPQTQSPQAHVFTHSNRWLHPQNVERETLTSALDPKPHQLQKHHMTHPTTLVYNHSHSDSALQPKVHRGEGLLSAGRQPSKEDSASHSWVHDNLTLPRLQQLQAAWAFIIAVLSAGISLREFYPVYLVWPELDVAKFLQRNRGKNQYIWEMAAFQSEEIYINK